MSSLTHLLRSGILFLLGVFLWSGIAHAHVPGAIFTTTENGDRVNANIYQKKEDVYLDGGPGPNAPKWAAGLPDGLYYFQVTDPSGKTLLSVDPISSRSFLVEDGIIVAVVDATEQTRYQGKWWGTHQTGVDQDHGDKGAITIQLMPYADTPNKGGVYKVWATPVERYVDPTNPSSPKNVHGFIPAWSKTDNFKVKGVSVATITVIKFIDLNANGVWDEGEPELESAYVGWPFICKEHGADDFCTNSHYTPETLLAAIAGEWNIKELPIEGWRQTCAFLDGVPQPLSDTVAVPVRGLPNGGTSGNHVVIFGNTPSYTVHASKFYDANGNGVWDELEVPIPNWRIGLRGNDIWGGPVDVVKETDAEGSVCFEGLFPGEYEIYEIMPEGPSWEATTDMSYPVTLPDDADKTFIFGNVCTDTVGFGTKGYWHNKNGLTELQDNGIVAIVAYVNGLAPYSAPSGYFGAGDEPFDGTFEDGTPVAAVNGAWGELVAPAGSVEAEISRFLVDPIAGSAPHEQLAQQLLAFIFNAWCRLGSLDSIIDTGDGKASARSLIDEAVAIWEAGTTEERLAMAGLLDALNNNQAVKYICPAPCDITYPE